MDHCMGKLHPKRLSKLPPLYKTVNVDETADPQENLHRTPLK